MGLPGLAVDGPQPAQRPFCRRLNRFMIFLKMGKHNPVTFPVKKHSV
jgi:hypothetical protein